MQVALRGGASAAARLSAWAARNPQTARNIGRAIVTGGNMARQAIIDRNRNNYTTPANRGSAVKLAGIAGFTKGKYTTKKKKWRGKKYGRKKSKRRQRKAANKATTLTDCINKGFVSTQEITGVIADTDVVHVLVSSYAPTTLVEMWFAAMLRVLFRKGIEWHCTGMDEVIPGLWNSSYPDSSANFKIQLVNQVKSTGAYSLYWYDTASNDTIRKIVGNALAGTAANAILIMNCLKQLTRGYGSGDNLANIEVPYKLVLYKYEPNVTSFYGEIATLNLQEMTVHNYSSIELKIQNRTQSGSANTSGDDIAVNPLEGKKFTFSTAIPKTKVESQWQLEELNQKEGMTLQGGSNFATSAGLAIPNRAIFKNVLKTQDVVINPGEIQWHNFKHQNKGDFNKQLLEKMRIGGYSSGIITTPGIGVSQLISLEDVINYDVTQKCTIAYEMERKTGCYVTFSKKTPTNTSVTQASLSAGI